MTLVILYKTKVKHDAVDKIISLSEEFSEIYEKHGIDVIGHWQREEKPHVHYLMTRYADEAEYDAKVKMLQSDERYKQLSAELKEIRTDFKAKRLLPTGMSKLREASLTH